MILQHLLPHRIVFPSLVLFAAVLPAAEFQATHDASFILDADFSQVTEFAGGHAHPGKDRKGGHFGPAGHHDPVMFRDIFIKPVNQPHHLA